MEIVRSALSDPVAIYVRMIKGKVKELEAKKQDFADALLMDMP